jgi:transcriptional regulator
MKSRSTYLQGTVQLLVLQVLSRQPLHGYGIAKWIAEETGGVLELEDAALYQALHRMEAKDLIEAEWGRTDTGRRAKLYRLTTAGRKRLAVGAEGWRSYAAAVLKVLDGTT